MNDILAQVRSARLMSSLNFLFWLLNNLDSAALVRIQLLAMLGRILLQETCVHRCDACFLGIV